MGQVHLDHHTTAVTAYTDRIEMAIEPFRAAREALITIPGVSVLVADVIIAETSSADREYRRRSRRRQLSASEGMQTWATASRAGQVGVLRLDVRDVFNMVSAHQIHGPP